jgi:AraC-like DNA-binding protein
MAPKKSSPSRFQLFLEQLNELLLSRISDADIRMPDVCRQLGCSKSALSRNLRSAAGTSFSAYLTDLRLRAAAETACRSPGVEYF